jgi:hypothetical protein
VEQYVANCVVLILTCEVSSSAWNWYVWYAKKELQTPIEECLSSMVYFSGLKTDVHKRAVLCSLSVQFCPYIGSRDTFCSMLCLSCYIRYCTSVCKVLSTSEVLISRRLAELRKASVSYIMFVRLSLLPHGTVGLQLYRFSWNLIFELFFKKILKKIKFH